MGITFESAQPYVTGACHFFIGRGGVGPATENGESPDDNSFGPEYLGTAEFSPRIQIDKVWIPLFNDLGGPAVPFDLSYAGKQAFLAVDLTRWNSGVLQRIDNAPTFFLPLATPGAGTDDLDNVGTLVNTEGFNMTVWAVFPYKKFPAYDTMLSGYRFPFTVGIQSDLNRLGTQPKRIHVNMHAIRAFDLDAKQFVCFDHDMSAVEGLFP